MTRHQLRSCTSVALSPKALVRVAWTDGALCFRSSECVLWLASCLINRCEPEPGFPAPLTFHLARAGIFGITLFLGDSPGLTGLCPSSGSAGSPSVHSHRRRSTWPVSRKQSHSGETKPCPASQLGSVISPLWSMCPRRLAANMDIYIYIEYKIGNILQSHLFKSTRRAFCVMLNVLRAVSRRTVKPHLQG